MRVKYLIFLSTLTAFCRHTKSSDDKCYRILHGGTQIFSSIMCNIATSLFMVSEYSVSFSFLCLQVIPSHSFNLILTPMNYKVYFLFLNCLLPHSLSLIFVLGLVTVYHSVSIFIFNNKNATLWSLCLLLARVCRENSEHNFSLFSLFPIQILEDKKQSETKVAFS